MGADCNAIPTRARALCFLVVVVVVVDRHARTHSLTRWFVSLFLSFEIRFDDNVPQEWYRNYVSTMDLPMMFAVREASNFMDIKPLHYLTNVWLTFQLMGKSVDEVIII